MLNKESWHIRINKRAKVLLILAFGLAVANLAITAATRQSRIDFLTKQIEYRQTEKQKLHDQLQLLEKSKATTDQQKQELEKKSHEQQQQINDLNTQLQAKIKAREDSLVAKAQQAIMPKVAAAAFPAPRPVSTVVDGCGDNAYAHFIYMRESGCNTSAVNAAGCRGIGQACPGSKLPCGADYGCQNAYFTQYAIDRYGSWQQAYNYWLQNSYW